MLQIGTEDSSYAERSTFEADPMLQVSDPENSSAKHVDLTIQRRPDPNTDSYVYASD